MNNETGLAFWSGFLSGGSSGVVLLDINVPGLVIDVSVKIFVAVAIAFLGGIAGVAGKDFYQNKIKRK